MKALINKMWLILILSTIAWSEGLAQEPQFDFKFNFNKFEVNNEDYLKITPIINKNKSPEGARFVRIDYYWDERLISSSDRYPFNLNYQVDNQNAGKYVLRISVTATGDNMPNYVFNFKYDITVLDSKGGSYNHKNTNNVKSPKFNYKFDFSFNKFQLYNGERLTMTPEIDYSKSPVGASFVKVNYSWDGDLIATENQTPFNLNYQLKNLSVGKHKLNVAAYVTGTNLPTLGPFNFDYTITILGTLDDDPIIAENNPAKALELGNKYYNGKEVPKDYSQAFYWYKNAAEQNVKFAKVMLAFMYYQGQGTRKNTDAAIFWYKKATEDSSDDSWQAWTLLGNVYQELQNYSEAFFCFKKGAENPTDKHTKIYGAHMVGYFYEMGWGVEKDIAEAKKWYKLSADGGYELAVKRLEKLGGYTNPSPNPNVNLAKLSWISSTADTYQKKYNLQIGVNSSSKVEDVTIYVNEEVFRGINAVINDGYTSKIERTLALGEGNNLIKVSVRNASGIASIEKSIVVKSNDVQPSNERRIALIIGNSNYTGDNKLSNPVNDATDMARKLEQLGFVVVKALDQTKQGMESAISQFGTKAAGYDVALFYYAGHGIRCDGVNYLVPVDADLPDETSVKYNCTNANMALDYMEKANCKMKIVILDACRNNPFERSWYRGMDGGGLSIMNAPVGTFIAFSTSPGNVALDGKAGQRNSPYTSALLEMLDMPNVSLTDFFQEVLERVAQKTNDKQIPWTSNSFRGKFYFNRK